MFITLRVGEQHEHVLTKPPETEAFGTAEDIQYPSQPWLATLFVLQPGISIVEIPSRTLHGSIRFEAQPYRPTNVINIKTSSTVLYLEIIAKSWFTTGACVAKERMYKVIFISNRMCRVVHSMRPCTL